MAKKSKSRKVEQATVTPKELARARRERKARRQTLIAISVVVALVVIVLSVGIINELIVKPGQPVAEVGDVQITTKDFQERVRFQRMQTITLIEQYAQLFGVDQVSSIAAQLDEYETIGQQVLDSMTQEVLVRQAAGELGISVSEEEVSRYIEEQHGYYRDGTPTPLPTTAPLPTSTPITPTETLPTPAPTRTPYPTATPVTEDGFDDLYGDQLGSLRSVGVSEDTLRQVIEYQLLLDKVRDYLMQDVPTEADQVQLDVLIFGTEEEANGYLAQLAEGDSFDSLLEQAQADSEDGATASTVSWTPVDLLAENFGSVAAQLAFSLGVGEHSDLVTTADGRFIVFRVSGHEIRDLSASALSAKEDNLLSEWLGGLQEGTTVVEFDYWRDRVPETPALDLTTLIPTPTPAAE